MKNKYNIQISWYVHSVQSSRRASAWEAMVRLALAETHFGLRSQPWWICFPTVKFIWNSFLFLLISLNISNNSYFTLTAWRYNQASGGGGQSCEFLVGVRVCHPVLQILTLFQTKNCNFQYPFSDLSFRQKLCHHSLHQSANKKNSLN